jgi:hypothetical protein
MLIEKLDRLCARVLFDRLHSCDSMPLHLLNKVFDVAMTEHRLTWRHLKAFLNGGVAKHCSRLSLSAQVRLDIAPTQLARFVGATLPHVNELSLDSIGHGIVSTFSASAIGPFEVTLNCRISSIDLSHCFRIDDDEFERLFALLARSLLHVNVSGCLLFGDKALRSLASRCGASLRSLVVADVSPLLSDVAVLADMVALRALSARQLERSVCNALLDAMLRSGCDDVAPLERLTVSLRRGGASDEALCALLAHCGAALTDVSLCWHTRDGGRSVADALARHCTAPLRSLSLSGMSALCDDALRVLVAANFDGGALRSLDLSYCDALSDDEAICALLGRCATTLEHVDLSSCRRFSCAPLCTALDACPRLAELGARHLSVKHWTPRLVAALADSERCARVDLGVAALSSRANFDALFAAANAKRALERLVELDLSWLHWLGDAQIAVAARRCLALRRIDLSLSTALTDDALDALAQSRCADSLRSLTLNGLPAIGDDALARLLDALGDRLRALSVSSCASLDGSFSRSLHASIESLNVAKLNCSAPLHVCAAIGRCSALRELNVSAMRGGFDNRCVRALLLGVGLPRLCWLRLASNDAIGEFSDGGDELFARSPSLLTVDLEACTSLTDADIDALARHCRNIRSLSLAACRQLDDRSLHSIELYLAGIKELSCSQTSFSVAARRRLRALRPSLQLRT